jgi:hypothetical protein
MCFKKLFSKSGGKAEPVAVLPEEKKVGVELIKKTIKAVWDTVKEIIEAKKSDNKITLQEWLGLTDNLIAIGSLAVKFEQIKAEVLDVDSAEFMDITQYAISLGIAPAQVQVVIEHSVSLISKGIEAYKVDVIPIIEVFKKK